VDRKIRDDWNELYSLKDSHSAGEKLAR
jgi:hypothetical protein